jgi:hypothetical protein
LKRKLLFAVILVIGVVLIQGLYEEAEGPFKRALTILQGSLGPEHPDVMTLRENLALLYEDMGRSEDAEKLRAADP